MANEIVNVATNIYAIAHVEKVKEVTPRPEEGKNTPMPFDEVTLLTQRERERHAKKGKKELPQETPPSNSAPAADNQTLTKEENKAVDVIV